MTKTFETVDEHAKLRQHCEDRIKELESEVAIGKEMLGRMMGEFAVLRDENATKQVKIDEALKYLKNYQIRSGAGKLQTVRAITGTIDILEE